MNALDPCDLQSPPASLAVREPEFRVWIEKAAPGKRIEYFRGHLAADRTRGLSPFGEKLRREIDAVAGRALTLAEEGRLLLVQRRHGPGDYSYVAIKPNRGPASRDRGGR